MNQRTVSDGHRPEWPARLGVFALFVLALTVFAFMYLDWLPRADGRIGYDYGYFLPQLLDGWYWISTSGVLSVPWFTPSFCGGIPAFANPQNVFFSTTQILTLLFDPLTAVQVNFILFAGLGFWGTYLCCRTAFDVSRPAATLAATVFLFNGFFVSRYLMGHLTFHVFSLLPWVAHFALRELPDARHLRRLRYWSDCVAIGLLVAYTVFAGAAIIIPLILVSLIAVELAKDIQRPTHREPVGRLFVGIALGILMSAAKIAAALSVAELFPRDHYPLAGMNDFANLFATIFASLFLADGYGASRAAFVNDVHDLGAHEFRYGVTLVPFVLLSFAGARRLIRWRLSRKSVAKSIRPLVPIWALILVLLIPVALNYYAPEWHSVLKRTPFIRSNTTMLRWFAIYILPLALMTGVAVDYLEKRAGGRLTIAMIAIIAVIALKGLDGSQYIELRGRAYDPRPVTVAYKSQNDSGVVLPISAIRQDGRDADGHRNLASNNALITGESQMSCYESMFGFSLERFPQRTLQVGPVNDVTDGALNLKNPACYAFPEANSCRPGDHFHVSQKSSAELFAARKPFPFGLPLRQRIANWVTLIAIPLTLMALLALLIIQHRRRPSDGI